MSTDEKTETINYMKIVPQMMTLDMIRSQFGPVSFAYTKKDGYKYEVIAISDFDAPLLRSKLLIDKIQFRGVNETEFKIVSEVV